MPALKRLRLWRIVAAPAALNLAAWSEDAIVLRTAPDEVLAFSTAVPELKSDPHALIEPEDGFAGVWLEAAQASDLLARTCRWDVPEHRPAFAQGAVAGIPVKLWLDHERTLLLAPAPYAIDFQERLVSR